MFRHAAFSLSFALSCGAACAADRPQRAVVRVPLDAHVSVVGVYRAQGPVTVTLAPGRKPLVLALASHEPVEWVLHNKGRRRVVAVLMSGAAGSSVMGFAGKVHVIGTQSAWKMDGGDYLLLKDAIGRHVANPLRQFQGEHTAAGEFTVGGK